MSTVTVATPQLIAELQSYPTAFALADASGDAAIAAKFDPLIASAKAALDKVTADRDAAMMSATVLRKRRDLMLGAMIQNLQSGQPVPVELPEDPATTPAGPATE